MRLKYQLFLILLLVSGSLIGLMVSINSWSFDRGFINYVNDTERQRLEPLIDELAVGYARENGWGWVANDRDAWKALSDTHLGRGPSTASSDRRRKHPNPRDGTKPQRHPVTPPALLPINPDFAPLHLPSNKPADEPPPNPLSEPPRDARTTLTLDSQLLLADADQSVLIGSVHDGRKVRWQPIRLNDQTIGSLGHRERQTLSGGLDQAFAAQQRRVFVQAAFAMVLLSALLAIVLAGRLARPLLDINDAVTRISRGQYTHRVPDARGDELGDLSRSINSLASTLTKNLDARRQWLAEISHELRTPVAVFQAELETIQDGVGQVDTAVITSLHAETLRLARLIDDLHALTLSDVGALDYRFERLDLANELHRRLAPARKQSDVASLSITVSPPHQPLHLNGDAQRLGQLFDNLLQNSLRYSDAPAKVHVTLSRNGDLGIIDWSDSAPGVNDEQLTQLFDPLYRTDQSRSRQSGGAGLGLAIVQRIVEAHRGTVTADHSSLDGLAIHIELPLLRERVA